MSMKFFRQTKETKRKLSFFMALAMVISLLPVSPAAKAAETAAIKVYSKVSKATVKSVAAGAENGKAVITLKSSEAGKVITSASISAQIVRNGVSTNSAVEASGSVNIANTTTAQGEISTNGAIKADGTYEFYVSGITTSTAILLTGEVELVTSSSTPSANPSGTPSANPSDAPSTKPSATPVPKYGVSVTNKVGENILLTVGTETIPKTGSNLSIEKGTKLDISVAPNGDFIWKDAPELTIDGTTKVFESNGAKYTNSVVIDKKTAIVVSGGSVEAIPDNVVNKVENATKPAAGHDETVKVEMKGITSDIISAIVADDSNNLTAGAIVEALKGEGTINTVYKVSKSTSEAAINTIKNGFDNMDEKPEGLTKEDYSKAIEDGYAVDIDIKAVYTIGDVTGEVAITVLKNVITITMPIPAKLADKKDANGDFYAFRLHDGEVTAIKCGKTTDGKLTIKSDKFSTYVISFVPSGNNTDDNKPTPPSGGGGIGGYVPSTSATPAPSATAAPSASPSADPSATPGVDSSAAPSESGAPAPGGDTTPTKAPTATDKPVDDNKDDNNTGGSTTVKVGKKATVSGSQYKVTAVKGTRTVQFTKGKKNAKSIVVPSTVKISGKNYKVTTIAKNAFKGNKKLAKVTIGKNVNKIGVSAFQNCSKLKSIVIKSTKLTAKKVGKNAFKGINKKATFKVPKSKVKAYKKIVKAKGAGKNVKVKK